MALKAVGVRIPPSAPPKFHANNRFSHPAFFSVRGLDGRGVFCCRLAATSALFRLTWASSSLAASVWAPSSSPRWRQEQALGPVGLWPEAGLPFSPSFGSFRLTGALPVGSGVFLLTFRSSRVLLCAGSEARIGRIVAHCHGRRYDYLPGERDAGGRLPRGPMRHRHTLE